MHSLRESTHRAQRVFLLVNAVPFAVGSVMSCFTEVPAVALYGKLTLGLVWGALQGALFVTTAWWYEFRSTRSSDPIEQSFTSGAIHAGASVTATANRSGW
ncbi:hypothetical protein ACFWPQ_50715 [Streptomyces sp. NPDC058464]|uniref:hypothetical protein n=1 Tax=unclassified Streptomyces TaxID=2593676 RepID=UPI00364EE13C